MKRFKFYQDVKVTMWQRQYFEVEAESKEEALKEVELYKTEDVDAYININSEYLFETMELMTVEDNSGNPTIELYDDETGEMLGNNAQ